MGHWGFVCFNCNPNNRSDQDIITKESSVDDGMWWHIQGTKATPLWVTSSKRHLCGSPVHRSPNIDKTIIMQTDASDRGIWAVLSQHDDEESDHRVYLERRYSAVEKECLAIKLGIQAFWVYLLGKPFIVYTDDSALVWLDRLKEANPQLTRWSSALQPYQFTVHHREGNAIANAGALSCKCSLSRRRGEECGGPVVRKQWTNIT